MSNLYESELQKQLDEKKRELFQIRLKAPNMKRAAELERDISYLEYELSKYRTAMMRFRTKNFAYHYEED